MNVLGVVSRVRRKPRNMYSGGDKNLVYRTDAVTNERYDFRW